jgi:PAS domain S-box-containing protein
MAWRFTPLAAPLFVGALLMAVIAALCVRRRRVPGAVAVGCLAVAVAVYVVGYAMELGAPDLAGVRHWLRVQYLGLPFVPGCVLGLVLVHTGLRRFAGALGLALLFAIPATTSILAWTNDAHGLVWERLAVDTSGSFAVTSITRGAWYTVHNVYVQATIALTLLLLAREIRRTAGLVRRQLVVLAVATAIPATVHAIYLTTSFFAGFDPNPFALVASTVALAGGVLEARLLDLVPVARDVVFASLRDGVLVLDARDRLLDANAAGALLLPCPLGTAVGRPLSELLPAWSEIAGGRAVSDAFGATARITTPAGLHAFDVRVTPLHADPEEALGRVVVLREVTAQLAAEEELRLRGAALEAAANGIVITDREGRVRWANPAFTRLTGWPLEEARGQKTSILRSGAHHDAFYAEMWKTVLAGRVWHGELVNRRRDGSLYSEEQTIAPVTDASGQVTHFIAVKLDVSERKAVERLRQDLIGMLVHDLRNPLTVIRGAFELMPQEAFVPAARRSITRLLELVSSILEVHALRTGKFPLVRSALRLHELVDDALVIQGPLAREKAQRLEAELPPDLPTIDADARLLARVLQNLIGNAVKFTHEGGAIRVAAEADASAVTLSVSDDGPGLPPDIEDRVFEEFARSGEGAGSGLGLAFCRRAVEAHGGRVVAISSPGRGTTIRLTLPRDRPA